MHRLAEVRKRAYLDVGRAVLVGIKFGEHQFHVRAWLGRVICVFAGEHELILIERLDIFRIEPPGILIIALGPYVGCLDGQIDSLKITLDLVLTQIDLLPRGRFYLADPDPCRPFIDSSDLTVFVDVGPRYYCLSFVIERLRAIVKIDTNPLVAVGKIEVRQARLYINARFRSLCELLPGAMRDRHLRQQPGRLSGGIPERLFDPFAWSFHSLIPRRYPINSLPPLDERSPRLCMRCFCERRGRAAYSPRRPALLDHVDQLVREAE